MKLRTIIAASLFCCCGMSCSSDHPGIDDAVITPPPSSEQTEDNNGNSDNNSENSNNDNNGNSSEQMNTNILITIGTHTFSATLADNEAARMFAAMLPMTVNMTEMNGNEKYHSLSHDLPTDTFRPGTIHTGDLLLWGSDTVVLFYETFSSAYSYTRLGRIDNPEGLASAVGSGNVQVTFSIQQAE